MTIINGNGFNYFDDDNESNNNNTNLPNNRRRINYNDIKKYQNMQKNNKNNKIEDSSNNNNPNINNSLTPKDSEALDKNKKNRFKNTLNNLKGKKKKKKDNDEDKKEEKDNDSSSDNNNDDDRSDEKLKLSKRIKIKLIILGLKLAGVFLIFLFILVIIQRILSLFGITLSFTSLQTYGNSDYKGVTEEGTEASENEKKYYAKLNEVANSYKESCNLVLNKDYIHAVLVYKYINNPSNMYDVNSIDESDITEYSDDNKTIDYQKFIDNVSKISNMMVTNCTADYELNGNFYNNLKTSSFIKDYYKDILKEKNIDEILKEVFDIADVAKELNTDDEKNNLFISSNLRVNIINSNEIVNIKDYLKGTIYAYFNTTDITDDNKEMLKAYTIAKLTNTLSGNYKSDDTLIKINNELYCDINKGCYKGSNNSYLSGGTSSSSGGEYYINELYYYRKPLSADKIDLLNKIINEVFGIVMMSNDNNGIKSIDMTKLVNISGKSYQDILSSTYQNIKLKDISEDNYTSEVEYKTGQVSMKIVYYNQNDYLDIFCGREGETPAATFKKKGCGVASMSIVASTLIDPSYKPLYMMEMAHKGGYCGPGISGTSTSFFKYAANKLGLGYQDTYKSQADLNKIVSALSSGKSLVIAWMGTGTFTRGGHYIVLSGINATTKQVFVNDPNNRNLNGKWYSLNDVIAKEAKQFFIITKG